MESKTIQFSLIYPKDNSIEISLNVYLSYLKIY